MGYNQKFVSVFFVCVGAAYFFILLCESNILSFRIKMCDVNQSIMKCFAKTFYTPLQETLLNCGPSLFELDFQDDYQKSKHCIAFKINRKI